MILFGFALFVILVAAWLLAPSTEKTDAKHAAMPALKMSELPAD
jgi:hypothetical protein